MPFGANHIKTPSIKGHLLGGGNFAGNFITYNITKRLFLRGLFKTHFKIAAKLNIGAATRHIGGNCHRARHPGIGNDHRLFMMHPSIQYFVGNFTFGQLG